MMMMRMRKRMDGDDKHDADAVDDISDDAVDDAQV